MDWTGSGDQRREQGLCLPPERTIRSSRLAIPAGTDVLVCRVDDHNQRWTKHTTKERLEFRRYEARTANYLEFRHLGYFVRVPKLDASWYSVSRERNSAGWNRPVVPENSEEV